jgi:hypothetical protein
LVVARACRRAQPHEYRPASLVRPARGPHPRWPPPFGGVDRYYGMGSGSDWLRSLSWAWIQLGIDDGRTSGHHSEGMVEPSRRVRYAGAVGRGVSRPRSLLPGFNPPKSLVCCVLVVHPLPPPRPAPGRGPKRGWLGPPGGSCATRKNPGRLAPTAPSRRRGEDKTSPGPPKFAVCGVRHSQSLLW